MTNELENKLNEIVGKTFNYRGKNVTISKYKFINGTNVVVFLPNALNLLLHEVKGFLEELFDPTEKEKTETQILIPKKELVLFEPTAENKIIKSTLLETLEKVKNDSSYIAQAKTVCEIVNSMVDIQKNEIKMLSLINKFK